METIGPFSAFSGCDCLGSGKLSEVALRVKDLLEEDHWAPALVFDNRTGRQVEVDLRGTRAVVRKRLSAQEAPTAPAETGEADSPRGPGRPKLGVVAREVTLLPRHWDWLGQQPGGASVAMRKLVEEARRGNAEKDRQREARDRVYRFISAVAGNQAGFEEASRALFAGDRARFGKLTEGWGDVGAHALAMGAEGFDYSGGETHAALS